MTKDFSWHSGFENPATKIQLDQVLMP